MKADNRPSESFAAFQTAYCVRPSETFILYYMHSILLTGLLQRLLLALAALALIGGVYFWAVGA
jgi:hypothetical protein